jgi:hypothetical protein
VSDSKIIIKWALPLPTPRLGFSILVIRPDIMLPYHAGKESTDAVNLSPSCVVAVLIGDNRRTTKI